MIKSKVIKISLTTFTVLLAFWFAIPGRYTNAVFKHDRISPLVNSETKLEASQASDLEEEYKKPVYFNIFKFVNNFIPTKR